MITVQQTTKHGLEVYEVLVDGIVVGTAWSIQGAKTIMLKLLNRGK
jgi:hypothetical protein